MILPAPPPLGPGDAPKCLHKTTETQSHIHVQNVKGDMLNRKGCGNGLAG